MEIVTIENEAFKLLMNKIDRIADFVVKTERVDSDNLDNDIWMDSNEVAKLLRISTRTLQRLRSENAISYTMLRGRCLYKLSEIHRCLDERVIRSDAKSIDDFKRNYELRIQK